MLRGFEFEGQAVHPVAGGFGRSTSGVQVDNALKRAARGGEIFAELDVEVSDCVEVMNPLPGRQMRLLKELFDLFEGEVNALEMFSVNPGEFFARFVVHRIFFQMFDMDFGLGGRVIRCAREGGLILHETEALRAARHGDSRAVVGGEEILGGA